MIIKMQSGFISRLLIVLLAGLLLLSACSPAVATSTLPNPTATSAPMATVEPAATILPAITVLPTPDGSFHLSLDTGSLATGFQTETMAAVPASDDAPYWEVMPEYTRVSLQGYPISSQFIQPQIFIYPVNDLGKINEGAGNMVFTLQSLIQSPQEIPNMPFLPLFNKTQVLHAHIQYLDFNNGQGLRYLTEFSQGIVPIHNNELMYTYQGLTNDGKYYVAAVLPVNHPNLPADGTVTGNEPPEFTSDYPVYLANVAKDLNSQAANTFTPDLTQLDAMMSSLEIK
ncbi:MAG: hypothetical protein CVU39_20865 [Chloroflexi bacterium HGW-Chloroflexi-10]|nr:MAG: hypothetical protein CVU39_20865 [Chloroflexi bacterium HGW-Chloroflexi-10]